jgi:CRISPR system Cascade subunit CasE
MFLSQLNLKCMDRGAMRALTDVYRLHQLVMKGFAAYSSTDRVLYRVEPEERNGQMTVLVQSLQTPDWSCIADANRSVVSTRVKEFSTAFKAGDCYSFRLRANPVVTRDGKRHGLIRDESLLEWLGKKQEKIGVRFRSMSVVDEGYVTGTKGSEENKHRMSLKIARFEGVLEVVDPVLFQEMFSSGVGPAKAFGCESKPGECKKTGRTHWAAPD